MDNEPKATEPSRDREGIISDDDQLLYLMDEISRTARRIYDAKIARIGLNQTQWRIIGQLLRDPALTQVEIAKKLELESATIGQAVAALCEGGVLERQRAETDRRAWQLILTEKLDSMLPELRGSADEVHDLLWRGITTDDKRVLGRMLGQVSANLNHLKVEAQ